MEESKRESGRERLAASDEGENESPTVQKGGVADKSKDGLGSNTLGGEGKPDRRERMRE